MKRMVKYLSLSFVLVMLLYVLSIVLQFYLNFQQWQIAGADYGTSPQLPAFDVKTCMDGYV